MINDFGKKLKDLRKERRLTQKDLASLSGVSPSYLSRVERGQRSAPHPSILKKLAKPLQVKEATLLALAGYITPEKNGSYFHNVPKHWQPLLFDQSLDEMLQELGTLTLKEKESLYLYLKALKLHRRETQL